MSATRLSQELSPYLRQHAFDPVDWYPWGAEAIDRARREDKPIFLSVGYSTCYFCHLMGRETFADPGVGEFLNDHFVSVLVDREERPDIDEVYTAATQLYSHRGGWPNSVFLTPSLEPYFCGGYFPREGQPDQPSFSHVAVSMADAWQQRRAEVEAQAEELSRVMRSFLEEREPAAPPTSTLAGAAYDQLVGAYDEEFGGFGKAAKFPLAPALLLLEELATDEPRASAMLGKTLEKMACGGILDQVGGGFHRYATDRQWRIPHFEKLLGENGLLLEIFARQYARTGDPEMARVTRLIAGFLSRELGASEGGFRAAAGPGSVDAPLFQAWRLDELVASLGDEDAGYFAPVLGYDRPPFFENDYYVLYLPEPLAAQAARRRTSYELLVAQLEAARQRLYEARVEIKPPFIDAKILTDQNGLAIAGLAAAGEALGDGRLIDRAQRCAEFVLGSCRPRGALRHAWRDGEARHGAFLSDYVFLIRGLLKLYRVSGEERWLASAVELSEEQLERLAHPAGGFQTAPDSAAPLPWRHREVFDGALPAANAEAIRNLLELADLDRDPRWHEIADRCLAALASAAQRPEGARTLAVAARRRAASRGSSGSR